MPTSSPEFLRADSLQANHREIMSQSPPPLDPNAKWAAIAGFGVVYVVLCLFIPALWGLACGIVPTVIVFCLVYTWLNNNS